MTARSFPIVAAIGIALLLAACSAPSAQYPVASDPLSTYQPPSDLGERTATETQCIPDDNAPAAAWDLDPQGASPEEVLSELKMYALDNGWMLDSKLRSTSDTINLRKKRTEVRKAGGREDEGVTATIFVGVSGKINVAVMSELNCP